MVSSPRLVFLIGAARSGTKFLRDVLSADGQICRIPYDINYVWRYGNEHGSDDVIQATAANLAIRSQILSTLEWMARKEHGPDCHYIVEKTVGNVFRVPFLYALFPDALFIHLIRDGRDVAVSAEKEWRAPRNYRYLFRKIRYFPLRNLRYAGWYIKNMFFRSGNVKGIWGPRYPGIEADLGQLSILQIAAKQWALSVHSAIEGLESVPVDQQITIHYEDLISDIQVVNDLLDFIRLERRHRIRSSYRQTVRSDNTGKWMALSSEERKAVIEIQHHTLRRTGYRIE